MKRKIFLLIILSALLIILDKFSLVGPIRNVAGAVLLPVVRPLVWAGDTIQTGFNVLTFFKSGEQRIKNLEQKNWELNSLAAQNELLRKENELLKAQQAVKLSGHYDYVLAKVLNKSNYWVLDRGSDDGVKVGSYASVGGNLIGKVVKADAKISFLQTIYDPDSEILVIVQDVRAAIVGKFGTTVALTKVNQDEKIEPAATIYTIEGLMVGKVGQKKSEESDIYSSYEIKSEIDFSKANMVLILVNEG